MREQVKLVRVTWVDSALFNDQTDDLPKPEVIISSGWLAKDTDDYLVVVRDWHQNETAFEWRGSCAIPKCCIQKVEYLEAVDDSHI